MSHLDERSPVLPPAHQTFEKLRRQHQLILNSVCEGIYGLDLQGHVTFVNPAAARMIGWEISELIGRSMHDVLHHSRADGSPYPREACPIYAAFQDGMIRQITDEVFWRRDGTSFPVEYISTPMHDEQGELVGTVVTFRDITERRWAETVLHRANEELELKVQERTAALCTLNEQLRDLSDLKSRLVAMVCHEFRNPLNNILLSATALERYSHQLDVEQKGHYLTGIKADVERMTQMIDDILVLGKVEAKKIDLQLQALDLVMFCQSLVTELQPSLPTTTPATLSFSSRHQHLVATLDERLLRSILTNILANSLRYSPEGGRIDFKLFRSHNYVVFQIKDQGLGIPPEDQLHLFEPFHRGKNVSNIPGTGLGLSIVKRFVELHQGKIEVKSKVGVGTTFSVFLPLHLSGA